MLDHQLELLKKYDVAAPRYTSYPTVPYWEPTTITADLWRKSVTDTFINEQGELSIYIHLPFCESLCTFCACNKRITVNHGVERPYIDYVLTEWKMYLDFLPSAPTIKEIHLGGGTPSFFSAENLEKLINGITKGCKIAPNHEFSIEVHPNYTTRKHLERLAHLGFNRISLGVQDFDAEVQYVINRIQTYEVTNQVVLWARELNYNSVNIDLVYGLPKQKLEHIGTSIAKVNKMMPDRIAFYSYAHVPWKSRAQRRYTDDDVPKAAEKWAMYQFGRAELTKLGFEAIGMDHFALPADKLVTAAKANKLHRNFMGYTTTNNPLIIGLGVSSISDSWTAFAQNEKEVEAYQERIAKGEIPLTNGHLLNIEDLYLRKRILELMCNGQTTVNPTTFDTHFRQWFDQRISQAVSDGLCTYNNGTITVTTDGQLFIRNISTALDARLQRRNPEGQLFSRAI